MSESMRKMNIGIVRVRDDGERSTSAPSARCTTTPTLCSRQVSILAFLHSASPLPLLEQSCVDTTVYVELQAGGELCGLPAQESNMCAEVIGLTEAHRVELVDAV